jgi:hypothetical protein
MVNKYKKQEVANTTDSNIENEISKPLYRNIFTLLIAITAFIAILVSDVNFWARLSSLGNIFGLIITCLAAIPRSAYTYSSFRTRRGIRRLKSRLTGPSDA